MFGNMGLPLNVLVSGLLFYFLFVTHGSAQGLFLVVLGNGVWCWVIKPRAPVLKVCSSSLLRQFSALCILFLFSFWTKPIGIQDCLWLCTQE